MNIKVIVFTGCDVMWSGTYIPPFHGNLLAPSGKMNVADFSEVCVHFYQPCVTSLSGRH
jgi:hypothetical protein